MTPKEHAEIWKKAAMVVGGMDTMRAEMSAVARTATAGSTWTSRAYSEQEVTANRAYSAAANVLYKIAAEYEAASIDT